MPYFILKRIDLDPPVYELYFEVRRYPDGQRFGRLWGTGDREWALEQAETLGGEVEVRE